LPARRPTPFLTWQTTSRIAGLAIIFSILIVFLGGQVINRDINSGITLAFLGIASGLVGAPDGFAVIRREQQQAARRPPQRRPPQRRPTRTR
jgi:hypothetical protein